MEPSLVSLVVIHLPIHGHCLPQSMSYAHVHPFWIHCTWCYLLRLEDDSSELELFLLAGYKSSLPVQARIFVVKDSTTPLSRAALSQRRLKGTRSACSGHRGPDPKAYKLWRRRSDLTNSSQNGSVPGCVNSDLHLGGRWTEEQRDLFRQQRTEPACCCVSKIRRTEFSRGQDL